ncbi:MAG: ATP-grasp domain-containing protein [Methylococcaceae bacterium]|jgi:predicted ATP-grasp superfamily ATP-dependent carboligase
MKILIFEYITGGGLLGRDLPTSLAAEGELMLTALLSDLSAMPTLTLTVLRDARLPVPPVGAHDVRWILLNQDDNTDLRFSVELQIADAVWPIAPETSGILEHLCRQIETAGKHLLTSPAAAVSLTASKYATTERLAAFGIPVIASRRWPGDRIDSPPTLPVVVKPDDGAGCEGIRIIRTVSDWYDFAHTSRHGEWVLQAVTEGEALSLSGLFANGKAVLLSINQQHIISADDRYTLRGCAVNLTATDRERYANLLDTVASAVPELWGYAGVDLLRTPTGLRVMEINPRLTTAYAGLSRSLGLNVARMTLDLLETGILPHRLDAGTTRVDVSW